jgi:hypothetical protein
LGFPFAKLEALTDDRLENQMIRAAVMPMPMPN